MNDEDFCPKGDECGVHNRVSDHRTDEDTEYGSYIDYYGEYCVLTGDNMRYAPAVVEQIMKLLGEDSSNCESDFYETRIFKVGTGTLWDACQGKSDDDVTAWRQTHSNYKALLTGHTTALGMLQEGMLDLSM